MPLLVGCADDAIREVLNGKPSGPEELLKTRPWRVFFALELTRASAATQCQWWSIAHALAATELAERGSSNG